jgi:hypothetical protein
MVRQSLSENGVLAICHFPAGENYLGDELLSLNKIVLNTLKSEFVEVLALPGDEAIYFAAKNSNVLTTDIAELKHRFNELHPALDYFVPNMFQYIYSAERIKSFVLLLSTSANSSLNTYFNPVSYIYDFLIWRKIVRGESRMAERLFSLNYMTVVITTLLTLLAFTLVLLFTTKTRMLMLRIRFSTAIIGFIGMTFSVLLLLSFQTLFGYIYSWVGAAMAAYMAGMAGASLVINKKMVRLEKWPVLTALYILMGLALVLLMPVIQWLDRLNSPVLYVILFAASGALVGATFPLLCRAYMRVTSQPELGNIYASDVLGGAAGAFLLSSFFIPIYGFNRTLLIAFALCLTGFLLLVRARGRNKA